MALTCAAATLFTMAGCGNAEGTEGGAETMESSTTADESGQITIEFAEHVADIQAQEPHLQKIITAFEESHPGIKIDITGKEVSEHKTQMTLLQEKISFRMYFGWSRQPQRSLHRMGIYMI